MPSTRSNQSQARQRLNVNRKVSKEDLVPNTDVELKKFIETNGHFSLVRNFHLADAFTLMNGFCGAQSLFNSGRFLVTSEPRYMWYALWFPLFGAVFDLLDGKIARWRRSSSMLGQELDSLADLVSFGVAPAFAAFALGLRFPLDTLCLTLFVCAGIARLARFNISAASIPHDVQGKARYFEGLPIPSSLTLVVGMALCLLFGRFEDGNGPWTAGSLAYPFTGTYHFQHGLKAELGVPLGLFVLDWTTPLYKLLTCGGVLEQYIALPRLAVAANTYGYIAMHKVSIVFAVWAMAMVSKTLRVPKP